MSNHDYKRFILQTGTGLHETGANYQFCFAKNRDLYIIKQCGTDSHTTEIHVLSAASSYSKFSLQTKTVLHETGGNFKFCLADNNDVYAIKQCGTDSHTTEIHVLSAASSYSKFSLQTKTVLHETGENFAFCLARNGDLYAVKKSETDSKKTEVHILSAADGYSRFSLQKATALEVSYTNFDFCLAANGDLYVIKKNGTGTNSTEIHVLSRNGDFTHFSKQTGTALHETNDNFAFCLADNDDFVAVKKCGTGTHSTELHILS